MATQTIRKTQRRQQRQQQKMNKGGFLKNLHLKWWVWIIIIIVGINIIGSALAPLLSTLGTFGKAMKNIIGVPEQIVDFANRHPWMYFVAFFAVVGSQLGLFGAAKTYIGKKMFREKAEGKSTEQTLSDTREMVDKKIEEKDKENKKLEEEGKTPKSESEIVQEISDEVTVNELKQDMENLEKKVKQVEENQEAQARVAEEINNQRELIENSDNIPENDQNEANEKLDDFQKELKELKGGGAP